MPQIQSFWKVFYEIVRVLGMYMKVENLFLWVPRSRGLNHTPETILEPLTKMKLIYTSCLMALWLFLFHLAIYP